MADGETAGLERTLRDLLGLLALPASWRGRSPGEILASFSEALDAIVDVEVIAVAASPVEHPADVVRIGKASAAARSLEVRAWLASLAATSAPSIVRLPCGELGDLSVVCEPLGDHAALGHAFVASGRPGFPSPTEIAIIRAATALATSALEASRAMRERDEALRARDDLMAVLGPRAPESPGPPHDGARPPAIPAAGGALLAPRRRRILVVDDNVDSGVMLAAALEMSGHEVRVLHDPFTVAGAARAFAAEIVVLELGMPGRDGYQVASDVQAHFGPQAPALVALTGYSQAGDRVKTTAAGFAAHLVKPVNLGQLLARIDAM
jgi:CheY-like chemotaxis protein